MRGWALLLGLAVGACGASTVDGTAGEPVDAQVDAEAPTADAATVDATLVVDGSPPVDAPSVEDAPTADTPPASGPPHVVELAVGSQLHQCARLSDGTVRCRGMSDRGQLGVGPTTDAWQDAPVEVPGLRDVEQVVTSSIGVTCTRHRDGTVRCWGSNRYDTLGTGHEGDERCSYPGGSSDPCRTTPALVPGLGDVVHLAASLFAVCAVRRDGSVWCWGSSGLPYPLRGSSTPVRVPDLADVAWMRAMLIGWIARTRDGRHVLIDTWRVAGVPQGAEVAEGPYNSHVCYRLSDATVRCLGVNANGKVGNGSSAWPGEVTEPWDPGLRGVRSIVTGSHHTCALMRDGTVRCWGDGTAGGLGVEPAERCAGINEPTDCVTRPAAVPGLDRVERLFPGVWGTCALRADRTVWCWGTLGPMRSRVPALVTW